MRRRKKKKPAFDAGGQARRLARAVLGTPPAERILPSKKRKPTKHEKRERDLELED